MHTYIHTFIHAYRHTYIHTYIHTCMHTFIHTYIHTYIHTFIHTYTHTHTHTFMHTYIGILGNELADHLAKSAAPDGACKCAMTDSLKAVLHELEQASVTQWEGSWMAVDSEGASYQIILSHRERENETKHISNVERHNALNRPRQTEILFPPLQNTAQAHMPLRRWPTECWPHHIRMQQIRSRKNRTSKQHMEQSRKLACHQKWPATEI